MARRKFTREFKVSVVVLLGIAGVIYVMQKGCSSNRLPLRPADEEIWISVLSAEAAPTKPAGQPWDVDKSGPDVFYELWWQGNKIFTSTVQTDTLLPHWLDKEIRLDAIIKKKVLEATRNGTSIRVVSGQKVTVNFFDEDIVSNDPMATWEVDLVQLGLGTHEIPLRGQRVLRFELHVAQLQD